jgi:ubiquinone/menaquinone biosynthesis C-methylase UbiE
MADSIELLDTELLNDQQVLKEIDHWLKVLNRPNGWHYDLDIIWIIKNIRKLDLPQGATILDAGAGLGVMQFILASRGYNVISLDFTERQIPEFTKGIFKIEKKDTDLGGYRHEYMDFMTYGQKKDDGRLNRPSLLKTIASYTKDPYRMICYLKNSFSNFFNIHCLMERFKDHSRFGKITFLRATFNNITLEASSVDALISISAFEHNNYDDMPESIKQFQRVLKSNAKMFITTSASGGKDWYFQPAKGWNLSLPTLADWFGIAEVRASSFDECLKKIQNSKVIKSRIHHFYRYDGRNGLPYARLGDLKYVPVGIIKTKP